MATFQSLIDALSNSAQVANAWFMAETSPKNRVAYFAKGKLGDPGNGAVYAYFDKDGVPLYVGEASRPIKRRMHDQTSPHKKAKWWKCWETVRLLPVADRTDRLALELLLVLALNPKHNIKPGQRQLSQMFRSEP